MPWNTLRDRDRHCDLLGDSLTDFLYRGETHFFVLRSFINLTKLPNEDALWNRDSTLSASIDFALGARRNQQDGADSRWGPANGGPAAAVTEGKSCAGPGALGWAISHQAGLGAA